MKAAERLNVLVSRARNGLIVFGNMDTFMKSSQGKDTWVPFFKLLKEKQYLKDGLLVHCEQHPDRTAMLSNPRDFDQKCPDGGCSEPCGAKLKCGIHICQLRCHRLRDHSKIPCDQLVDKTCEKGHHYKVRCEEDHVCCDKCRKEEEDVRRRTNRDLQIEKDRRTQQAAYRLELQEMEDEIAHEKRLLKEAEEAEGQRTTLQQHRADLNALRETRERLKAMKKAEEAVKSAATPPNDTPRSTSKNTNKDKESAGFEAGSPEEEWEDMKRVDLAKSEAMDMLMGLVGLEDVKREFLNIKSTVDTAMRQGVSTKSERFGCSLLGNPGTGEFS